MNRLTQYDIDMADLEAQMDYLRFVLHIVEDSVDVHELAAAAKESAR